jgi:hypothetical protein
MQFCSREVSVKLCFVLKAMKETFFLRMAPSSAVDVKKECSLRRTWLVFVFVFWSLQ